MNSVNFSLLLHIIIPHRSDSTVLHCSPHQFCISLHAFFVIKLRPTQNEALVLFRFWYTVDFNCTMILQLTETHSSWLSQQVVFSSSIYGLLRIVWFEERKSEFFFFFRETQPCWRLESGEDSGNLPWGVEIVCG